jgi:hypothetical protein
VEVEARGLDILGTELTCVGGDPTISKSLTKLLRGKNPGAGGSLGG